MLDLLLLFSFTMFCKVVTKTLEIKLLFFFMVLRLFLQLHINKYFSKKAALVLCIANVKNKYVLYTQLIKVRNYSENSILGNS